MLFILFSELCVSLISMISFLFHFWFLCCILLKCLGFISWIFVAADLDFVSELFVSCEADHVASADKNICRASPLTWALTF